MTSRVSINHFYSINIKNIEYLGRISAVYFQHATSFTANGCPPNSSFSNDMVLDDGITWCNSFHRDRQ